MRITNISTGDIGIDRFFILRGKSISVDITDKEAQLLEGYKNYISVCDEESKPAVVITGDAIIGEEPVILGAAIIDNENEEEEGEV